MDIKWDEITCKHHKQLTSLFKLYEAVFPKQVREPQTLFLKSLDRTNEGSKYHLIAGIVDNQLISFAAGHYLAESNTGFIVYIATNPYVQGKGVGTNTLKKMEEYFQSDARLSGNTTLRAIVLETEKDESDTAQSSNSDFARRNRFYEKNGYAVQESIHYLQPPLQQGGQSIPLNLFAKSPQARLGMDELQEIIKAMYKYKYDYINGIDREILTNCLETMGITSR